MKKNLRVLELPLEFLKVILESHIINLDKNSEPIKEKKKNPWCFDLKEVKKILQGTKHIKSIKKIFLNGRIKDQLFKNKLGVLMY